MKSGARTLLRLPPGSIPLGDATGWPDVPSSRTHSDGTAWPTHSWRLNNDGRPEGSAGDDPAKLRRHAEMANAQTVHVLLFGQYKEPGPVALAELAWVLAGTGCRPRRQETAWFGSGGSAGRPLRLSLQPRLGKCDPTRPLRLCAWQPRRGAATQPLENEAGPDEDHTRQARQAAARLWQLGNEAAAAGRVVPDGVVPTALLAFLEGIGVLRGEATATAARLVAELCEAVHWAELTRSREMALQLEQLGLHLAELLGGASTPTAPCAACGTEARRLFHVKPGTARRDKLIGEVNSRLGNAAAQRVCQGRGEQTRQAVVDMHAKEGVHVCISCARPCITEARMLRENKTERANLKAAAEEAEAGAHANGAAAATVQAARARDASKAVEEPKVTHYFEHARKPISRRVEVCLRTVLHLGPAGAVRCGAGTVGGGRAIKTTVASGSRPAPENH